MTTIAYRSGILASDSRITSDDVTLPGWQRKVFKLPDGSLFAAADDAEGGEILLRAMKRGLPPPRLVGDMNVEAIWISTKGKLHIFEGSVWVPHKSDYYALGTGRQYALGALFCGHSAIDAVRAGIEHDPSSGGRIKMVKLRKPR